jgi:hypothetical protein
MPERIFSMQILFSAAATLAAVGVAYSDSKRASHQYALLLGVPLLSWIILAALVFPTIRLAEWLIEALVKGLEMIATSAKLENVHYTLIGLSDALRFAPHACSLAASATLWG